MYKKASRLKLRFESKFGKLTVDQLWELKNEDLSGMIKATYAEMKKYDCAGEEELQFLSGIGSDNEGYSKEKLRFEILKDVYITRLNERKITAENASLSAEIKKMEEILAAKRDQKLQGMSEEELEKMILEAREKMKK